MMAEPNLIDAGAASADTPSASGGAPSIDVPHARKAGKRTRSGAASILFSAAGNVARLHCMWGDIGSAVLNAIEGLGDEDSEAREVDPLRARLEEDSIKSLRHDCREFDSLAKGTGDLHTAQNVIQMIERGIGERRNTDTRDVKDAIRKAELTGIGALTGGFFPLQNIQDSNLRGYNDDVTGRYLCPDSMDWDNAEDRALLRTPGYQLCTTAKYRFMYTQATVDGTLPFKGLYQSDIIVETLRLVFFKRNRRLPIKHYRSHDDQRLLCCGAVAYVTTLIYFALSAHDRIDDAKYELSQFYDAQRCFLSEHAELWTTEIRPYLASRLGLGPHLPAAPAPTHGPQPSIALAQAATVGPLVHKRTFAETETEDADAANPQVPGSNILERQTHDADALNAQAGSTSTDGPPAQNLEDRDEDTTDTQAQGGDASHGGNEHHAPVGTSTTGASSGPPRAEEPDLNVSAGSTAVAPPTKRHKKTHEAVEKTPPATKKASSANKKAVTKPTPLNNATNSRRITRSATNRG